MPCNNETSASPHYQACYNTQMDDDGFEVGCEKPLCWETYLGKQFYFLTLFDFVVQVELVYKIVLVTFLSLNLHLIDKLTCPFAARPGLPC